MDWLHMFVVLERKWVGMTEAIWAKLNPGFLHPVGVAFLSHAIFILLAAYHTGAADGYLMAAYCFAGLFCFLGILALGTMLFLDPISGVGVALPFPDQRNVCYLDYNATSPIFPEVTKEMKPFMGEFFGNPSSTHVWGLFTKQAVNIARQRVADMLGCGTSEIIFTSCGTEADNHAIAIAVHAGKKRCAKLRGSPLPHVVSSTIEHPAILAYLKYLEAEGTISVTLVGCDGEGRVSPSDVKAACRTETVLVTIMHSNNEVGTLQPVKDISETCKGLSKGGLLVHTDAAQSAGKVRLKVSELGVDMLTLVGHKFGAPKGVAALYVRDGIDVPPFLHGGGQEGGRRGGTENVLLITGLGKAAQLAEEELEKTSAHMRLLRDYLQKRIKGGFEPGLVHVNGPDEEGLEEEEEEGAELQRLPNTLSIGIRGILAAQLLSNVKREVAASAGAACHSGGGGVGVATVSPVLKAMGVDRDVGLGTMRLSVGRHSTPEEVQGAAATILIEARSLLAKSGGSSSSSSSSTGEGSGGGAVAVTGTASASKGKERKEE